MGVKLSRNKPRNLKLSLAYRIKKYLPFSAQQKLKLFLDLAWIFERLAKEQTNSANLGAEFYREDDFLIPRMDQGMNVLDLGCGRGDVIQRMLPKSDQVVGVDYDKTAIDFAKKTILQENVHLFCEDIFNYLKNDKNQYDLVVLFHVLEHIENPDILLRALEGRTRYLYVECPDFEANYLNQFRVKLDTDLIYTDADHVYEFDRHELRALIERAQFKITDQEFKMGVIKYWCVYQK